MNTYSTEGYEACLHWDLGDFYSRLTRAPKSPTGSRNNIKWAGRGRADQSVNQSDVVSIAAIGDKKKKKKSCTRRIMQATGRVQAKRLGPKKHRLRPHVRSSPIVQDEGGSYAGIYVRWQFPMDHPYSIQAGSRCPLPVYSMRRYAVHSHIVFFLFKPHGVDHSKDVWLMELRYLFSVNNNKKTE